MERDPTAFWYWFRTNADRFRDVEVPEKEQLLDEIQDALHRFHPELFFELGGAPEGPSELVITAEGNAALFPIVEQLVATAPVVPGWQVVAFKQPGGFDFVLHYSGMELDPRNCWCLPLVAKTDPRLLGVRVASPAYSPDREEALLAAIYVLLDSGLGELAAARSIQHVEVGAVPADPGLDGYIPLRELPDYLAWLRNESGAQQADAADEAQRGCGTARSARRRCGSALRR